MGQGASIKTRAHLVDWLRVQWTREHRGAVCGYRWRVTVEGDEGLVQEPAPERNWEQRDDDLPPLEEALLGHFGLEEMQIALVTREDAERWLLTTTAARESCKKFPKRFS